MKQNRRAKTLETEMVRRTSEEDEMIWSFTQKGKRKMQDAAKPQANARVK
jgi:hypothetical protein